MPSWIAKAAVQGLFSVIPGGRDGNRWLQSRRREFGPAFFDLKLDAAQRHLEHFFRVSGRPGSVPFEVLELGTGRVPIVPLALAMCGARQVTTVDAVPLLQPELTRRACRYLLDQARSGPLSPWLNRARLDLLDEVCGRFDDMPLVETLHRLGVDVRVGDIRQAGLPAQHFDLIASNNTLEHIAPDLLREIFACFHRLAAADGVMSHFIDMVDHYSHFDHRLTPYNFLRYRARSWALFNNALQYQNRWRVTDYRGVHSSAGFHIVLEENDDSARAALDAIRLAPEFRRYQREDLAVTTSWMVSRKTPAAA